MEFSLNVFERVRDAEGRILPVDAYQAEFADDLERATATVWKLERAQDFYEPDVASWRAMMAGEWEDSLSLLQEMGPTLTEFYRIRPDFCRVRIVERPLTPYLQWEMHALAVRAAAGERPRVLAAEAVREFEHIAALPELVVFGPSLLYEVLYDDGGGHIGGRRVTDPDVIVPCLDAVRELYDRGEDLLPYFDREVVPLPPPSVSLRMREPLPDYSQHTGTFRP
ncbi:DUF6879 family protein [Sphaerimonospora cavernae]|uniref:DUF6879 family protein n=1 Tax=Sphaerimonospora cavernae TaxID=1740611 RepID=A0ABV6UB49_9ACTN